VLNTSHGEGQCLPLMEFMSCGKPAVSPRNTAMVDYIDHDNAFVIDSQTEPTFWPHDPRQAVRALRYRLDWGSLVEALHESYHVAQHDPARYVRMAAHAKDSLEQFCSSSVVRRRLQAFLAQRIIETGQTEPINTGLAVEAQPHAEAADASTFVAL
jgi:glycosyltransferase involved in cell wall biosynthesis